MMNHVAKYSIANCVFGYINEAQLEADTAYVGIFTLTAKGMHEIDFDTLDFPASVIGAVMIRSGLGGGIGFSSNETALEILRNDHYDLIKAFIDTIPQKNIVLFDDGERYAPTMMEVVLEIAKEVGKKVTVVSAIPPKYDGRLRRRIFDDAWSALESKADESILWDFSQVWDDAKSLSKTQSLIRYKTLKKIAKRWKRIDKGKTD